ncbi:MAG TPA: acylphosphatase [Spirochaetota bacterium]|nr:acylphosphatase [Spirochaetota bacterium]HPJ33280.1 acylphosphatase [Spirochaetota bacterium]
MAKKVILKGRVQGVGCRGFCAVYARHYGLHGSATNMGDGSVRLVLDSDDERLVGIYINALLKNPERYPFYGRITDIDVTDYAGRVTGDYLF